MQQGLEIANKTHYFPYVEQPPAEKAKLLKNDAFKLRCKYLRRLQKAIRLDL